MLAFTGMLFLLILVSTAAAVKTEGWNFMHPFLAAMRYWNWNAQFLTDFTCYLLLSGIWIMWRHGFTPQAISGGLLAMVLGFLVFAPYLLFLLLRSKGDVHWVLTGTSSTPG